VITAEARKRNNWTLVLVGNIRISSHDHRVQIATIDNASRLPLSQRSMISSVPLVRERSANPIGEP
jgi:hypothetical protein